MHKPQSVGQYENDGNDDGVGRGEIIPHPVERPDAEVDHDADDDDDEGDGGDDVREDVVDRCAALHGVERGMQDLGRYWRKKTALDGTDTLFYYTLHSNVGNRNT
ncbi:hypothetical protein BBBOND_0304800 [Babesia bigemina]|uniref:Uncharacterized protein n=1 Tax=Babesia bigemina TaxID=5866 RepID=A0A061D9B2_BABBI|nr:hypothetical protein BBBOND_0304800 [Babesia bigemina]CDR96577.1 hypothetical protein BBBOND_0304800 [Babesia bigemina]|eukprot:XP_012768763.1 hypothetical protein BBBOND_0304800 [Babesia bigemina]